MFFASSVTNAERPCQRSKELDLNRESVRDDDCGEVNLVSVDDAASDNLDIGSDFGTFVHRSWLTKDSPEAYTWHSIQSRHRNLGRLTSTPQGCKKWKRPTLAMGYTEETQLTNYSNYYESYDIMVRRTKEFDRAPLHVAEFLPFIPDHQVAMMSSDPRLKAHKELVKGLMLPGNLSSDFAPVVHEMAFGTFIAGSDTVSTSMGWAVKFLADNPAAQAKLRRQLHISYRDAHDEKRQPDVSEIFHISAPYLDAFIEESLRCGKTVPTLLRQATVDTEILGYHIPKGTQIFLGIGPSITEPAMPVSDEARSPSSRAYRQRLPSWDDDEITHFKPERWLKTRGGKTKTGAGEFDNVEYDYDCNAGPILSFGAGSRACFGKRLAYLEMRIMITLLVFWNFAFEKCAPELSGYVERDEFTCVPTCCYVKLQRAE
ncbi:hypothetical protein E4U30_003100 [Claviceps sp. LM220 group G6]|nr:hypothetical protein E4U30_003100 [Claviceps sp. LM220 group G6]